MSEIKVDTIGPRVDNGTLTIGASGDTVNIAGTAGTGFPTPTTGIAASAITTGTMATARLGSGTASSSTFLRGDQTYAIAGELNTPSFGVRLSSDQTVANQTATKLALATEDWDTNSAWDASNYSFTVPNGEAGKYWFGGHVRILQIAGHDSTNYFSQLQIRKNNSTRAEHRIYDYSSTVKDLDLQVFKVMDLGVGDNIDFRVYHNGSGQSNQNIASSLSSTYFAGFKVTT